MSWVAVIGKASDEIERLRKKAAIQLRKRNSDAFNDIVAFFVNGLADNITDHEVWAALAEQVGCDLVHNNPFTHP